ncbi:MAG: transporter, family, fosmidomycin resistance protein [Hyphomicrobiales bacterium]|jgi:MFS family permease|nr:transporter, family, fosmidomycin resistance protein [Hyphomicrobiales bacterium]
MTQLTDVTGGVRATDTRIISLVCSAHFVSHFYILALPPLFPFIRDYYGVSYTQLGFALTAFNVTTALCQTPAGFLVDRIGARSVLVCGLVLGAICLAVVGLIPSFWLLVAMFALFGVANGVYHPADYAILSRLVSQERAPQAFSLHIFAGFLGTAVTPATMLILQGVLGWQGAFVAASMMGLIVAIALVAQPAALFEAPPKPVRAAGKEKDKGGWSLLLSGPILLNLLFFVMITFSTTGVQNYSAVALHEAYGTPIGIANTALTANLMLSAFGVLAGGVVAARVGRPEWIAAGSFLGIALTGALIGITDLSFAPLLVVMSLNGFVNGLMQPSRDMIVRAVTPEGQFGKVFGFVTTGFNIGGIIAPLLFGWVMDAGHPRAVFFLVCGLSLLAILTLIPNFLRRRAADQP